MNTHRLLLLNTSILTTYGTYQYTPVSLEQARQLVVEYTTHDKSIQSAIGHQATADLLTTLLAYPVEMQRTAISQRVDDVALVFKLKERAPEGRVLSLEEITAIGYEFGVLVRTA